jgi:probable F420-dependent oxidoreductase
VAELAMGASFGIALSLVILAGSELFTGNNMVMTIGSLRRAGPAALPAGWPAAIVSLSAAEHRRLGGAFMLTKSGMRLGIGLPQVVTGGRADADVIRQFAQRAEALGYEDLWLTDGALGARALLEPVTLLAYAAACTQRIRLGISVLVLNQHNPIQLARSLATLDQLSGGRVIAGVGLGGGTDLYPAFGIDAQRPVARFTESLSLMRALWSQERVTLDGEFFRLDGVAQEPKPLQEPLPVWIGGHATSALRRAVRLGDGWMGAGATRVEDFFHEIAQVREFIKEFGRDPHRFTISKRVYIAVDETEEKARQRLAAGFMGQYGNARMAESAGLAGTPKQVIEVLRSMRDAGLQHLLLHPFFDSMQQLELLTNEVAPEL